MEEEKASAIAAAGGTNHHVGTEGDLAINVEVAHRNADGTEVIAGIGSAVNGLGGNKAGVTHHGGHLEVSSHGAIGAIEADAEQGGIGTGIDVALN